MTKPTQENATATVNVLLALREHAPGRYRELHAELRKTEQREQEIRAELSRLEKHAAIEGIALADASPAPVVPVPLAEPEAP